MKSILIIGAFGYKKNSLDGQTIKTRNVYEALSKKYTVTIFDTQDIKEDKLKLFKLLFLTIKYKYIMYAGAQNNLKFFFPLLFILSKIRNGKIVYVTIGGWLYDFLKSKNKVYTYMIKNIKFILVETNYLKESLKSLKINNVNIIPNFRITPNYEININKDTDTLNIVFMARIVKEKGIYLIFEMLEKYISQKNSFNRKIKIDFYGQIAEKDKNEFNLNIKKFNTITTYQGVLQPKDIYSKLTQYDLLLLPTFYPGEGFPGTILDAYLCGLPVIATRWKQIPEFVDERETGFLIEYNSDQLLDKINLLSNDKSLLQKMKNKAYQKSKQYSPEVGLKTLEKAMFS